MLAIQEKGCVCRISRYKRLFATYLRARDPFDPFAILKFRSRGCYYWQWLLHQIYSCCDVRRLPSINLSTAPLSSSSSYNNHRPTLNDHHRHHDPTFVIENNLHIGSQYFFFLDRIRLLTFSKTLKSKVVPLNWWLSQYWLTETCTFKCASALHVQDGLWLL